MSVSRSGLAIVALSALWMAAAGAWAQPEKIRVEVMVSHISGEPGTIDPGAEKLHRKLRDQFRYESLRVLRTKQLALPLDAVGTVELPNGKRLRVRPLDVGERGVLMAVSVEGAVDTDLRAPSGHLVVISAGSYRDGKLIVSLEPRF